MKYCYWVCFCLLLISCGASTPPPTPIPPIEPMVQQTIQKAAEQTLGHSKIDGLVVQEIRGLNPNRFFVFSFQAPEGLMIGAMSGQHDRTTQEFNAKTLSIDLLEPATDPFISQASIENAPFYVLYGYMPSQSPSIAKIFLKNGEVFYFAAGSGLQARMLTLANPAVRVEIVDTTDRVIMEQKLRDP